jgi:hypothetical protein
MTRYHYSILLEDEMRQDRYGRPPRFRTNGIVAARSQEEARRKVTGWVPPIRYSIEELVVR